MIDPNTKIDGEEFEAYNVRRWGGSGWTQGLKRSGRKVGANFGNWRTWPNTLRAHQLIAYVTDRRRVVDDRRAPPPSTSECNAAIFDAMYERGENVSLTETLVRIGTERLGVADEEVPDLRSHLETNAGAKDVIGEIQSGRRRHNIKGVPHFVVGAMDGESFVGRPYGFSGAQDSSAFVEMFEELAGTLG
jgi:predicted DsbA family dithiol-disulfide isomerase